MYANYVKAAFDSDDNPVTPASTSSCLGGFGSAPVIGGYSWKVESWKPYVSKSIAQSAESVSKTNWAIDQGQRRIDYTLNSGINGPAVSKSTDTLTITDTIPAGEYAVDSTTSNPANAWNVTYANTSSTYTADTTTNGGAGGSWSNDDSDITKTDAWKAVVAAGYTPSYKLTSTANGDGSTTLTWTFTGWAVGYAMPNIHYSAVLGTPDDIYTDLNDGDTETNKVTASTTTVHQTASDEETVTVLRQQTAAAVKATSNSADAGTTEAQREATSTPVGFDISFTNQLEKADNNNASIVDVFPTAAAGNLPDGYTDPGDFILDNVSLEGKSLSGSTVTFEYVTNDSLQAEGKTAADLIAIQNTNAAKGYTFPSSDGWKSISLTIGTDGTINAASIANVKAALEGQHVVAVGLYGSSLTTGASWRLHIDYDWTDAATKLEMQTSGNFYNGLSFYSSFAKKGTTSTADSLPQTKLDKKLASDDGVNATYTITATNPSVNDRASYIFTDTYTNIDRLSVVSAKYADGSDASVTYNNTTHEFTITGFAAKGVITITVTGKITNPELEITNSTVPQNGGDVTVDKVRVDADGNPIDTTVPSDLKDGDDVYYKLSIANNNDADTIKGVDYVATDTFTNLVYQGTAGTVNGTVDASKASDNNTITWTPDDISAGVTVSVILHFTVRGGDDATYVNNQVTSGNHSKVVTDPLPAATLDKTLTSIANGKATYDIVATNTGRVDLTGWVFDENMTNLTYDSVAVTKVTDAAGNDVTATVNATATYTNGKVTVSSIPVGDSVHMNYVGTYTSNDFNNTVRPDNPGTSGDDGDWTILKTRVDALGSDTPDTSAFSAGDTLYYKIYIKNNSTTKTVPAASTKVTDTFTNLIYTGYKSSISGAEPTVTDGTLTWEPGEVATTSDATLWVSFTVADGAAADGYVSNKAKADSHVTVTTDLTPQLEISKTLASYNTTDKTATYAIKVHNTSKCDATPVVITENYDTTNLVDGSMNVATATDTAGITATQSDNTSGSTVTLNTVPAGATVIVSATFTVNDTAKSFKNAATLNPDASSTIDKQAYGAYDATTGEFSGEIKDGTAVTKGQTIYYKVTRTANGATGTKTVTDTLSAGLTYVTSTSSDGVQPTVNGNVITWNSAAFVAAGSSYLMVEATVDNNGTFNSVSNAATDGTTTIVITNPLPAIIISKTVASQSGNKITYNIHVENTGLGDAKNYPVDIKDEADSNLTYDKGTITNASTTDGGKTITVNVPAGKSADVTMEFTINDITKSAKNYAYLPNEPQEDFNKQAFDADGNEIKDWDTVAAGQVITYVVTRTNTLTDGATVLPAATVTDTLSDGLTYVDGTAVANDNGTVTTVTNDSGTVTGLTWNCGAITANTEGTASSTLTFKAIVGTSKDLNRVSNAATDGTHTVVITNPLAHVVPTKDLTGIDYNTDGTATAHYKVTLKNTGEADLKSYIFDDQLTNGSVLTDTVIVSNLDDATATALYTYGSTESGTEKGTFAFTGLLKSGDTATITYDATIKVSSDEGINSIKPHNGGNWKLSKLRVSADGATEVDNSALKAGDTVWYLVTVDNTNGIEAVSGADATVTDTFENLTYVGKGTVSAGTVSTSTDTTGKVTTVTFAPGEVAAGDKAQVWLEFTVADSATDGKTAPLDTVVNMISADEHTTITHDPVVKVTDKKKVSDVKYDADGNATVTYEVTVENTSVVPVSNYQLTERLSNGTINADSFKVTSPESGVTVDYVVTDDSNGTVTVDKLAAGATVTFTYTANVTANSAMGSENQVKRVDSDWDLIKERVSGDDGEAIENTPVSVGDTVWYKVTIDNTKGTKDVSAADALVNDEFTNLTYVSAGAVSQGKVTGTVNATNSSITWAPGTVAVGDTATVYLEFKVAATAVDGTSADQYTAVNAAHADEHGTTIETPVVSVKAAKSLASVEYNGDGTASVTYTVLLTNSGKAAAKNYQFKDTMVNGSVESVESVSTNVTIDDNGIVTVNDPIAAGGGTATVTLTATVTKAELEASNQVKPPTSDWDLTKTRVADNESTEVVTDALSVGDTVWYLVTVDNTNGTLPVSAADATVTDTFKNLVYVGAGTTTNGVSTLDSSKVVTTDNDTASAVTTVTFAPGEIAAKSTAQVWLQFKVSSTATDGKSDLQGTVENKVTADSHGTTTHDPVVDATLAKSASKVVFSDDGTTATVSYTVTAKNNSLINATNYVIKDAVTNGSIVEGSIQGATYDADAKTFTIDKIETGDEATITYDVNVPVANLDSTNKITPTNPLIDTNKTRVDADGSTTIVNSAVQVGDVVWYRIAVTNNGTATATAKQTVVTDTFTNLTFKAAGTLDNDGTALDASILVDNGDGTLTFNPGELAAGKTAEAWVSFTVPQSAVSDTSDTQGTVINTASGDIILTPIVSVEPTKTLTKVVYNTDDTATATYKVTLTNTGKIVARGYQFAETMVNGTDPLSIAITSGNATYANGVVTMMQDIPVGDSVVVTYTATVAKSALQASNQVKPANSPWNLTKTRVDGMGSDTATDTTLRVGDTVYYRITIDNSNGTADLAANTTKTTEQFQNLTYVGAADKDCNAVELAANADGTYTWEPGMVLKGTSVSLWVEFTVSATATDGTSPLQGTVANTASADEHTVVTHDPVIDIKPVKDITKVTYNADGLTATVSYSVTLTNKSAVDVTDYQFTDTPTNGNILSDTVNGATFDPDSSTFTVAAIASGEAVTITYDANVPVADLSGTNKVTPPNSKWSQSKARVAGDNDATVVTGGVNVGDTVWYLVTIDNSEGTEPVSAADAVTIDTFTNLTFLKYGTITQGTTITIDSSSFRWEPGEVAAGAKAQLWVAFTVSASALDAGDFHDTTVNTANGTTIHTPVIEVKPVKTINNITYNDDGTATVNYQVVLQNTGDVAARDYSFSDTMINGTVTGTSENASYANGVVTLKQDIAPGKALTVNITATVTNAQLQASNQVKPVNPDWALTKTRVDAMGSDTAEDAVLRVGDAVYYKITIDNSKGVTDLSATLTKTTEQFKNLTYVGASDSTGATVTLDTDENGDYTWEPGQIKAGNSMSVWLEFTVDATATDGKSDLQGTVENTASADEHTVVTHDPVISLKVAKSATDVTYNADGTAKVSYQVTVSNTGVVPAMNYNLADTVSNDGSIDASSISCNSAAVTLDGTTFNVDKISAKSDVTFTYTATVADATLNTENQVKPNDSEWNLSKVRVTGNDSDAEATDSVSVGDTIWYKVSVDNANGTKAILAADATVTDTYANLTYVGAGTVSAGTVSTSTDTTGKITTVTFAPGEVAAGTTAQVWLQFKVSATATDGTSPLQGTVQNSAKADEHGTTVDTPVIKVNADKGITKVVYNTDGTATVSYKVTMSNASKVEAKNYKLSDTITNGSINADSVSGATYDNGSFTVASIAAGIDVTITYTATVDQSALASTNKVKHVESPWDLNKLRVDADGSETAKTSSLNVGDTVWYLVTIDNTTGTETISADDATVTDSFTNLTYVSSGEVTQGSVTGTVGTSNSTITWTPGEVAAGTKVQAWLEFTVAKSATDTTDANYSADFDSTAVNAAKADGHSVITNDPVITVNAKKGITKVAYNNDGTATVGYSVTLSNNSKVDAIDYAVADAITNGSINADSVSGATYDNGTFTVASIAAGADATITYTATVAQSSLNVENQVKPADSTWNLTKERVTGNDSTTVASGAANVNDELWYLVTIDNTNGTQDISAADALTTDTFTNLTFEKFGTVSQGTTDSSQAADATVTWIPGIVKAGTKAQMWVAFAVAASATDGTSSFPDTAINTASADSHSVAHNTPVLDANVDKTLASVSYYDDGTAVSSYTATVTNKSAFDATTYSFVDTTTNGTLIASSVSGATYDEATGTFSTGAIKAGQSISITYQVTVASSSLQATNSVTPKGQDWKLTKTRVTGNDSESPNDELKVAPGDDIWYLVTIDNSKGTTDVSASNATVTDTFTNLDYVGTGTVTKGSVDDSVAGSDSTIVWSAGAVKAGTVAKMWVHFTVADTVNDATANNGTLDTTTNKATCPGGTIINHNYVPKIIVTKTTDVTSARIGDQITYTVTATNTGKAAVKDYKVTDTMGTGLQYVSDDSNGVYDAATNTVVWTSSIGIGETVTYHITCLVTKSAVDSVTNTAQGETTPPSSVTVPLKPTPSTHFVPSWLPNTGDWMLANLPVILIVAALLLAAAWILRKKGSKNS